MLQYITLDTSWEKLEVDDSVTFHIPDGFSYKYFIKYIKFSGYYCYIDGMPNRTIFEILRIKAEEFVTSIVNYTSIGDWPQVKTIDDLKKVIKALDDECIKKWGTPNKNTPQFKVGDKVKILPRDDSQTYFPIYTDNMLKYAGQPATVIYAGEESCIRDLDMGYHWSFNALQLVTSEMDKTVDPHNLKNGDYIKIINTFLGNRSFIYLFKEMKNNKRLYRHAAYNLDSKTINFNPNTCWLLGDSTKITYATEEEKKLLDNALLEQGYIWNNLTKQLDSIGLVDIFTNNLGVQPIDFSSLYTSYIKDYTQKRNYLLADITSFTKTETQTETELNLFPKKKHYQLNFNY